MKKLLIVILCLVMGLSVVTGCGRILKSLPSPESKLTILQPSPTSTTTSTPIPPLETAPAPAQRITPVLSSGVLLPKGTLPDSDYSPISKHPERYYPNTTMGLIPAPDYGRVWPYIGGATTRSLVGANLIGICDKSGRIICDPYYNNAEIIKHGDHRLYAFIRNRIGTDIRYYDQYNYREMPVDTYETTLSSLDGSWAETYDSVIYRETNAVEMPTSQIDLDYNWGYQWRPTVTYEYITAQRGGKWGVLDWDGTVLLPFLYSEPVCFIDGLACVLSDDEETISFINIKGKTVLGPYESPPRQPRPATEYSADPLLVTRNILFYEGFARFYFDGKYGMMDNKGRIIVPTIYDFITSFSSGIAMTVTKDGDSPIYGLVNTDGVVIAEGLKDAPFIRDGKAIINYNWYAYHGIAVDSTGAREEYDVLAKSWSTITDNIVTYADGHTLTIPGATRLDSFGDDLFIAFYREHDSVRGTWRMYDGNGNALTEEQPGTYLWNRLAIDDSNGYLWMADSFTERNNTLWLYDLYGNPFLHNSYTTIIPIDNCYMVVDGDWAGLIDADENYIIKVSIKSYRAD